MNAPETFRRAVAASERGDLAAARRDAAALVAAHPDNPAAHQLLGVILCRAGDPAAGADQFGRALAADPGSADLRINLVRALADAGDLDAAIAAGEAGAADTAAGGGRDLLLLRAEMLRRAGRPGEAAALCRRVVHARADDFDGWNNLGNALSDAGDAAGAAAALERAVALRPASPVAQANLARALDRGGRHDAALALYRRAAAERPGDGDAQFAYGRALQRLGLSAEALPVLGTAARLKRTDPAVFVVIGLAFAATADLDQAERAYRAALHVDPAHAAAYLNLALLLERGNRLEALDTLAADAATHLPGAAETGWLAAMRLRRAGDLAGALAAAEASVPDSLDPALRQQFIGEVADRLDRTAIAFPAFAEMNRLTAARSDTPDVAGDGYRRRIEAAGRATDAALVAGWPTTPADARDAPAFLVGFLRSGTTLLDTMLMGHSELQVMEEEPILARIEEEMGPLETLAGLDRAAVAAWRTRYMALAATVAPIDPARRLVDKNPLATLRAPLIHRLFPDAKFLFALRHPADVVLSCWMQNFQVNEAMASFLTLEDAARMYDAAMTYWMHCRALMPLDVHTVRYEDLVVDPEREMRAIADWLGIAWEAAMLDHGATARQRGYIRTPSYAQVTEGVYGRAKGRWERYRAELAPILPILAPWVERFGYAPTDA